MTTRRHLVDSPTAPNSMLHAYLLVICNLCVYKHNGFFAISFFLKKFFVARLVHLFRFFCTVHQQLRQCLKMENIIRYEFNFSKMIIIQFQLILPPFYLTYNYVCHLRHAPCHLRHDKYVTYMTVTYMTCLASHGRYHVCGELSWRMLFQIYLIDTT